MIYGRRQIIERVKACQRKQKKEMSK
jgi:hypothetical protein